MLKSALLPLSLVWAGEAFFAAQPSVPPQESVPTVESRLVSWGYNPRVTRKAKSITAIVVHSCYNPGKGERYSVGDMLNILRKEKVAAHYLIDRQGKIYRLVPELRIAYHAGVSQMPDGRTGVNAFSVGVELLGHPEDTFTDAQYQALRYLLADLRTRFPVRYVKGHGEVAPKRKSDPWNIQWSRVRTTQFGLLP